MNRAGLRARVCARAGALTLLVATMAPAVAAGPARPTIPLAPVDALLPQHLAELYPPLSPRGRGPRHVTVIGLEEPGLHTSLSAYRTAAELPACDGCLQVHVAPRAERAAATTPDEPLQRLGEEQIDRAKHAHVGVAAVEAIAATCPTCTVDYVQAASTDGLELGAAFAFATRNLHARHVVSLFTGEERGTDEQERALWRHYYAVRGMTHLVAAGDGGSVVRVAVPSGTPTSLTVGGTTVSHTEGGWSSAGWRMTVAGCTSAFEKPTWQRGIETECAGRASNDLSAAADPDKWPFATLIADGHDTAIWRTLGGTSTAAALMAGWIAESGLGGTLTPEWLYSHPHVLQDVQVGPSNRCQTTDPCVESDPELENCNTDRGCTPGPGWDGPTGLGTPRPRLRTVTPVPVRRYPHMTGRQHEAAFGRTPR